MKTFQWNNAVRAVAIADFFLNVLSVLAVVDLIYLTKYQTLYKAIQIIINALSRGSNHSAVFGVLGLFMLCGVVISICGIFGLIFSTIKSLYDATKEETEIEKALRDARSWRLLTIILLVLAWLCGISFIIQGNFLFLVCAAIGIFIRIMTLVVVSKFIHKLAACVEEKRLP